MLQNFIWLALVKVNILSPNILDKEKPANTLIGDLRYVKVPQSTNAIILLSALELSPFVRKSHFFCHNLIIRIIVSVVA